MSIFEKLGLIESDKKDQPETPPQETVSSVPTPTPTAPPSYSTRPLTSPAPATQVFSPPAQSDSGTPDPDREEAIRALFQGVLDKNNLAGLDYYEFRTALINLQAMEPNGNEAQQYRSIFATFKAQGVDGKTLVESSNHYLTLLDAEREKVLTALKNKRENETNQMNTRLENLTQANEQKREQIEKLRQEISDNENEIFTTKDTIDNLNRDLIGRESLVEREHARITDEIRKDAQRISQYIDPNATTTSH